MSRWFRDTLFLRLFLLMWIALVVSHIAAFSVVMSSLMPVRHGGGGPPALRDLPTFPSLPPTPGLPREARRQAQGVAPPWHSRGGASGASSSAASGAAHPGPQAGRPPGLPALLLAVDYGVRVLVIGAAAFFGSRWLARPMRRLVVAAHALGPSLSGRRTLPVIDERSGTIEVREAARVFNGMARELEAQFRSRELLLAALSHDLKTPLTRIRMRLENDAGRAATQRSISDIQEMNLLLDSSLDVFRGTGGEEPPQAVDVAALVQALVDDMVEQGQEATFRGAAAIAEGRPEALRRVFANLLNNAVRYGRCAEVQVLASAHDVVVRIDDHGPGIPPELLDTVFQPFFRVESSRSRATGGTGLGLYIVRDLLRQHGGEVKLANRAEGGLRAEVLLPRSG